MIQFFAGPVYYRGVGDHTLHPREEFSVTILESPPFIKGGLRGILSFRRMFTHFCSKQIWVIYGRQFWIELLISVHQKTPLCDCDSEKQSEEESLGFWFSG